MVYSGLDPLFLSDASNWDILWIMVIKVGVAFAALMVAVMLMIWWERKFISDLQNRIGPNRTGPFGLLQTLADGIKLFFKEDLIPDESDRFVFKLAPFLSLVPAFLVFSVVPVAGDFSSDGDGTVTWFGNETFVQLADPHMGVLFVLAMSSVAVYGIMLAGWSSGSKYPLLGSVRASAQMVSYEAALGLALVAVLLKTGSLSTHDIALSQADSIRDWGLITTAFVPFIIFFIASTAELNRPPFDLVEAEQEIVGGFHTEYSSIRFALFFLAEFMNVITMSAIMITLFFGGPAGPDLGILPAALWGFVWFFLKLFVFVSVFILLRGTLPRLRYDQLMDLGWKLLIPLALGWVMTLALVDVFGDRGQDGFAWRLALFGIAFAAMAVFGALLMKAMKNGAEHREREGEEVYG